MRKLLTLALAFLLFSPLAVNAQLTPSSSGLTATGDEAYGETPDDIGTFIGDRIIAPAISVLGVIFFILFVYAGFLWMTAAGNTDQVAKAKRILTSVVIGAILVLGAYAITFAILSGVSGQGIFNATTP